VCGLSRFAPFVVKLINELAGFSLMIVSGATCNEEQIDICHQAGMNKTVDLIRLIYANIDSI